MTLKYIWRSFSLGCHFHVHFSYPWHAFASHGLPAIAELLVHNFVKRSYVRQGGYLFASLVGLPVSYRKLHISFPWNFCKWFNRGTRLGHYTQCRDSGVIWIRIIWDFSTFLNNNAKIFCTCTGTIQYNTMRVFSAPYTRNRTGRHYNSVELLTIGIMWQQRWKIPMSNASNVTDRQLFTCWRWHSPSTFYFIYSYFCIILHLLTISMYFCYCTHGCVCQLVIKENDDDDD